MKHLLSSAFLLLASCTCAHAWGRHDLITRKAFEGSPLERIQVTADPIDSAAEGLLLHAVPKAQDWAESYHREVDRRSAWTRPEPAPAAFVGRRLSRRQQLLWAIEDNVETPLDFSVTPSDDPAIARRPTFGAPGQPGHGRASTILEDYVVEPDAQLDNGFNAAPYFARLKDRMGLFFEGGAHTHTFRHYFVPTSLVPPLLTPQGDAPRQAAFYAELAVGAFQAGRPYWGYRFLAWSLHYAQDATQPWHTTLVPGLSFLRLSRAAIRKQV
ncbi:MAG: hypothetical protein HY075_14090, partial [Deltaproteobacteria bacterium]|nr:hypothetical protein [Deltaproteobacteria bacterium]